MLYLAATASCIACPKGFACPRTEAYFESGADQCKEHEYSTSSLLDFSGDDISAKASLRCTACSSGRYSNNKGAEYCAKCPKGFFSKLKQSCEPCPVGTYTLTVASEECFPVDSQSFIAWPASTLSDKKLCSTDNCEVAEDQRKCIGTEDAYCQSCPEIRPGHRTYRQGEECVVEACPVGSYSVLGCVGSDCCIPCSSSCKKGQHSVGCGGPDDKGGSTQNTQCADCPVDTFTQFDAQGAPCVDQGAGPHFGSQGTCSKCAAEPHLSGTGFTTKSPFTYLPVTHPQTHVDQRRCAAGSINTGSPTNSFPSSEQVGQCCSAAAYQCIPCRNSERVSYSYSYILTSGGQVYRWGRTNQPAWSTNGLTGQSHCQSYWYVWNKAARDEIVQFDKNNKPKSSSAGSDGS